MAQELRPDVRDEVPPPQAVVVLRGGPDDGSKLAKHAARTNRRFMLDGQPLWGISVFLALDPAGHASLHGLLSGRMRTYRIVHTADLEQIRSAGFDVLPTFARPHFTLVMPDVAPKTLAQLASALGPGQPNPYHGAEPRR